MSCEINKTMDKTAEQYLQAIGQCKDVFVLKYEDYGPSWRILRASSITDQILIKARRIRTIEETGMNRVDEGIWPEFIGIYNYSLIGLIQLELGSTLTPGSDPQDYLALYDRFSQQAFQLMEDKNHDYGEAWRWMRIESYTDLILMKINRIKEIENNKGQTLASEGVASNYLDIMNYAAFALIRMTEEQLKN